MPVAEDGFGGVELFCGLLYVIPKLVPVTRLSGGFDVFGGIAAIRLTSSSSSLGITVAAPAFTTVLDVERNTDAVVFDLIVSITLSTVDRPVEAVVCFVCFCTPCPMADVGADAD